ncbi:SGNH/GDSL hydrolase family protein [Ornithinicoccus halotolerans]|uniref:SGNH/GDSL hydrolase family protein n=1 Tax=Ornithinicoccus halotolerans TaxID=1748220 RepID=UPI001E3F0C04|nr:SGNH/GDSL hydrolase family protein [Ornithinicoccus halotolerans]
MTDPTGTTGPSDPTASARRTARTRPQPRPWRRYVAVGDSFTEGMSDPDPEQAGRYVGWADRLAALLSAQVDDFSYGNLAIRGRKLEDVVGRQLPAALELGPDLVSIVGGGNDILRPRADVDALAARLEEAVAEARAAGADVLLATPTDPVHAPVIRRTRGRAAVYTAHIWSIAQRHDCSVIHQWGLEFLHDWRMWAEDRIHLTTEGHRRVALAAYEALGHDPAEADWQVPLPPQPAPGRLETVRGHAQWARTYVAPWVQRRLQGRSSGDHLDPKRPRPTPPPRL